MMFGYHYSQQWGDIMDKLQLLVKEARETPMLRPELPLAVNANGSTLYVDGLVLGKNVQIHKSSIIYQDVWIGDNVVIKNACLIGRGAYIAPGSVLPSGTDVPENGIYGE